MPNSNRQLIHALEKSKKHGETLQSELHTVLDAPPEIVANHLEAAFAYGSGPHDITFEALNDDNLLFNIHYWNDDERETAQVKGVLRRWQGTQTRLDCDGDIKVPGLASESLAQLAATGAVVLLLGGGCLYYSMTYRMVYDWALYFRSTIFPFLFVSGVVAFIIMRGWLLRDPYGAAQYAALKDLDRVLQRLAKTVIKLGVIHEEKTTTHAEHLSVMVRDAYGREPGWMRDARQAVEEARKQDKNQGKG